MKLLQREDVGDSDENKRDGSFCFVLFVSFSYVTGDGSLSHYKKHYKSMGNIVKQKGRFFLFHFL